METRKYTSLGMREFRERPGSSLPADENAESDTKSNQSDYAQECEQDSAPLNPGKRRKKLFSPLLIKVSIAIFLLIFCVVAIAGGITIGLVKNDLTDSFEEVKKANSKTSKLLLMVTELQKRQSVISEELEEQINTTQQINQTAVDLQNQLIASQSSHQTAVKELQERQIALSEELAKQINMTREINQTAVDLQNQLIASQSNHQTGAVYTRWGRTICGNQSTLIYQGFAGGEFYSKTGGGTNYQCLPHTPEYNRYSNRTILANTWMHGAEYQGFSHGIFPDAANDENVPCARCYTNNRPAIMMLPAKRSCPDTWNKEYEGYLMTANGQAKHPTTYECIDEHPEYIPGQNNNTNGALFYFVSTSCKSIQCPPYHQVRELTCVLCTK